MERASAAIDLENQKILRHEDVIFNERKVYKDLLAERDTPEKDLEMASWSNKVVLQIQSWLN